MDADKITQARELQPRDETAIALTPEQVGGLLLQFRELLQGMAQMLTATNERVGKLERQIEQITPITGAQERAIGEKIKQRAEELAEDYRLPASSKVLIANAIRKDVKVSGGVRAIRELPRIDYPVYIDRIALWDDYSAMKAIKRASKGNGPAPAAKTAHNARERA